MTEPMEDTDTNKRERQRMVKGQIKWRGIRDKRVLNALLKVPRHLFIPQEQRHMAYSDGPLPIGENQTISQPYIVALMSELLALKGDERVLEVGTGSGYQSAILAHLAAEVHTIERHAKLADRASEVLTGLGLTNVTIHVGDGSLGLSEHAPYKGIIITAAAPQVPQPILDQLADDGRLVVPVGGRYSQSLVCWHRHGGETTHESVTPVAFVPLLGEFGWEEDSW